MASSSVKGLLFLTKIESSKAIRPWKFESFQLPHAKRHGKNQPTQGRILPLKKQGSCVIYQHT